ncbi:MAG: hypothetical protein KC468_10020, partial [Myxococcales bacterium]|nr:hypothetical protein [Myxococcales bacterium]
MQGIAARAYHRGGLARVNQDVVRSVFTRFDRVAPARAVACAATSRSASAWWGVAVGTARSVSAADERL